MQILRPTPDHRIGLWGNGPEICILVSFLCGSHVPQILEAPSEFMSPLIQGFKLIPVHFVSS